MSKKQVNITIISFAIALIILVFYVLLLENGIFDTINYFVSNDTISVERLSNYKLMVSKVLLIIFALVSLFQIIGLNMYLKEKKNILIVLLVIGLLVPTIMAIIDKHIINYIFALPTINILLYLYDLKDDKKRK